MIDLCWFINETNIAESKLEFINHSLLKKANNNYFIEIPISGKRVQVKMFLYVKNYKTMALVGHCEETKTIYICQFNNGVS